MGFLHAEVCAAVLYEHVELLETAFVQKKSKALTGGELAFLVLSLDTLLAPAKLGLGPAFSELLNLICLNTH